MAAELEQKTIAEIRRLEFKTKRLIDQNLTGNYRSAFKGLGIEFETVREYSPGDDTRAIDWKVSARYQKPFIKSFQEEREINVCLAVDVSGSSSCGTGDQTRSTLIAKISAILSLIAKHNNDKIGLLTFSDRVESYIPPKKAKHAVLRIIREVLLERNAHRSTNLALACEHLRKVLKKRSVIFLISDFIAKDYEQALSLLKRKHEVCAVIVRDKSELELPRCGIIECTDPESGLVHLIDSSNRTLSKLYMERGIETELALVDFFKRNGLDFFLLSKESEIIPQLKKYLGSRALSNPRHKR